MAEALTDYIPLVEKFLTHWNDSETNLGRALVLDNGTTRDSLQDLKEELIALQNALINSENDRQEQIKLRDNARNEALPMAKQVRKAVLGALPSSAEARELPTRVPAFNADAQKQLVVLRDIENIWTRVDALPAATHPGLVLPFTVRVDLEGTETDLPRASYSAAVGRLTAAASALEAAEQALKQAQQERKKVTERLKAVFLAYRKLIRGLFPRTSALYRSLP